MAFFDILLGLNRPPKQPDREAMGLLLLAEVSEDNDECDIQKSLALIKNGADVNLVDKNGDTALIVATRYGHKDIPQALINSGADVDATDQYGNTALYYAERRGYMDIAKALVSSGAHNGAVGIHS